MNKYFLVKTKIEGLNEKGKVFMTPTVYGNRKGIRASFVNWRTSEKDIQIVMEEMKASLVELGF